MADATEKGTRLNAIPLAELKKVSQLFDIDVAEIFDVRRSLAARRAIGAPSPDNVKKQIARWRKSLA